MNDSLFQCPEALLTKQLATKAMARNHIGEVAALYACRALALQALPISADKICPDFMLVSGMCGEIKSVGLSNSALIYKWRLEKEEAFSAGRGGGSYLYVFVRHTCPITCATMGAIVEHLTKKPPSLICCTVQDVREAVKDKPVRKFSLFEAPEGMPAAAIAKIGYNREGYKEGGWRFTLAKIKAVEHRNILVKWNNKEAFCRVSETARFQAAL